MYAHLNILYSKLHYYVCLSYTQWNFCKILEICWNFVIQYLVDLIKNYKPRKAKIYKPKPCNRWHKMKKYFLLLEESTISECSTTKRATSDAFLSYVFQKSFK